MGFMTALSIGDKFAVGFVLVVCAIICTTEVNMSDVAMAKTQKWQPNRLWFSFIFVYFINMLVIVALLEVVKSIQCQQLRGLSMEFVSLSILPPSAKMRL